MVVRINDRGPFVRGRLIDLTRAGAEKLGFIRAGLARVRLTVDGGNAELGSSCGQGRSREPQIADHVLPVPSLRPIRVASSVAARFTDEFRPSDGVADPRIAQTVMRAASSFAARFSYEFFPNDDFGGARAFSRELANRTPPRPILVVSRE